MCSKPFHLGPNPSIYDVSADCLISLKKFASAELYLLRPLLFVDSHKQAIYQFSYLNDDRGDLSLSGHYLNLAAGVDPHNPNLSRLKQQISDLSSKNENRLQFSSFL